MTVTLCSLMVDLFTTLTKKVFTVIHIETFSDLLLNTVQSAIYDIHHCKIVNPFQPLEHIKSTFFNFQKMADKVSFTSPLALPYVRD